MIGPPSGAALLLEASLSPSTPQAPSLEALASLGFDDADSDAMPEAVLEALGVQSFGRSEPPLELRASSESDPEAAALMQRFGFDLPPRRPLPDDSPTLSPPASPPVGSGVCPECRRRMSYDGFGVYECAACQTSVLAAAAADTFPAALHAPAALPAAAQPPAVPPPGPHAWGARAVAGARERTLESVRSSPSLSRESVAAEEPPPRAMARRGSHPGTRGMRRLEPPGASSAAGEPQPPSPPATAAQHEGNGWGGGSVWRLGRPPATRWRGPANLLRKAAERKEALDRRVAA